MALESASLGARIEGIANPAQATTNGCGTYLYRVTRGGVIMAEEKPCEYCDDGDELNLDWATGYQCVDLTDAIFEIGDNTIVFTVNEHIECEECGRYKTLTGYAKIHTWEVE
jgi:hypothetical protein